MNTTINQLNQVILENSLKNLNQSIEKLFINKIKHNEIVDLYAVVINKNRADINVHTQVVIAGFTPEQAVAKMDAIAPTLEIGPREDEEHYHLYIVSRQISADDFDDIDDVNDLDDVAYELGELNDNDFDQVNELDGRYRTLDGVSVAS